eukprot:scaffold605_cov36-Tisochrysis_lutea.AAC.4
MALLASLCGAASQNRCSLLCIAERLRKLTALAQHSAQAIVQHRRPPKISQRCTRLVPPHCRDAQIGCGGGPERVVAWCGMEGAHKQLVGHRRVPVKTRHPKIVLVEWPRLAPDELLGRSVIQRSKRGVPRLERLKLIPVDGCRLGRLARESASNMLLLLSPLGRLLTAQAGQRRHRAHAATAERWRRCGGCERQRGELGQ